MNGSKWTKAISAHHRTVTLPGERGKGKMSMLRPYLTVFAKSW